MKDYELSLQVIRVGKNSLGVIFPKYICDAHSLQSGTITSLTLHAPTKEVTG
jgi:hypothetical protein